MIEGHHPRLAIFRRYIRAGTRAYPLRLPRPVVHRPSDGWSNTTTRSGLGRGFAAMRACDWGDTDFRDQMAGIDVLARRFDAAPDRLRLSGIIAKRRRSSSW